jgi:multicomponent K+:H+ antiporter subunit G
MSDVLNAIIGGLLLIGSLFMLLGAYGLVKLPDFFTRLHAPTSASTLGIGSLALATVLHHLANDKPALTPLLLLLFIFISAPVTAYMLARCAREEQRAEK